MGHRQPVQTILASLYAADIFLLAWVLVALMGSFDILTLAWLLLGLPSAFCGYGIWFGKKWARTFTTWVTVVGALTPLLNLFPYHSYESSSFLIWSFVSPPGWTTSVSGTPFPGFIVAGVLLWYLRRKSTKQYFEG